MSHMIKEVVLNTGYLAAGSILVWHQVKAAHTHRVHAKVKDDSGHGEEGLQLRQVQVIFRHGARTPIHTLAKCHQVSYPADILMRPHPATVFPYLRRSDTDGGHIEWSPYQMHLMKTPLKGGSYPGMLTSVGQDQMLMLGRRLREAYGGVLGVEAWDPSLVYVVSTNILRTVESARCVLAGYFTAEHLSHLATPPTIYVCPEHRNFLIPDTHACVKLRGVNHTAMKESDSITEFPFLEDRRAVEALIDEKRLEKIKEIAKLDEKIQKKGERQTDNLTIRDKAASNIPQFWPDVMLRHPALSQLLTSHDVKCLTYLTGLEVQEIPKTGACLKKSGYRFTFHFEENPFFTNKKIVKEIYKFEKDESELPNATIKLRDNKHIIKGNYSKTTPILWKQGIDVSWLKGKSSKKKKKQKSSSFFGWLTQEVRHSDSVAEALRGDVYLRPSHYILNSLNKSDPMKRLDPERPEFKHRDVNFVYARDDIVARETHGWWPPAGLTPMRPTIAAHATSLLHMGMTGITEGERAEVTRLSVGRVIQRFHDYAERQVQGKANDTVEKGEKLILYSAHDSTLAAVMEALGIWDNIWPVYGADITMELWQKPETNNFFVRFLYNGQAVSLRAQQSPLIPWSKFRGVLAPYMITDADFQAQCDPELHKNREVVKSREVVVIKKEGEVIRKSKEQENNDEDDEEDDEVPTGM